VTAYSRQDTVKSAAKGYRAQFSHRVSSAPRRNVRNSDSGSQIVAMMQAAEPRLSFHAATCSGVVSALRFASVLFCSAR